MDIATIMDNISDEVLRADTFKKSILIERSADESSELKRDNSKAQIQWKEVPEKADEERRPVKASLPVLGILTGRGYRWHYIHDAMLKLRIEEMKQAKTSDDEIQHARKRAFNNLIHDFGSVFLQKRYNKNAELTLDQQTHLEILKYKVKMEQEAYLRHHPEIGIMIKLIYGALFKNQPQCPKQFVSDYVHHLNKHREELMVEDVDIPFDRPLVPEEISSEEEERRLIADFAKQIVESCINLAALGQSYIDVMGIINSMLRIVSPSEDEISIESSILNAEAAVSEVLMSLLKSVVIARSTSAEIVVDDLLNVILSNALPFIQRDSEVYGEMKGSVENFIDGLIGQLTEKVMNNITIKEMIEEPETIGNTRLGERNTRSILRKTSFLDEEQQRKTKVKFQSLVI